MNRQIMVSGGFDPVHIGHIRLIEEAGHWGHVLVVINSDEWLMRKKGYVFMPWKERADVCDELGIHMLWGVGGTEKPQSSSWLVNKAMEQLNEIK